MKNKNLLLTTALLAFSLSLHANPFEAVEEGAEDLSDTVKKIFPLVLFIIFILGFLFNAGLFYGEDRDIKKGIVKVLVFMAIDILVVGMGGYILTLSF